MHSEVIKKIIKWLAQNQEKNIIIIIIISPVVLFYLYVI